jgi:glycosyltransferase involved in cell wall biosynthesis
VPTSQGLTVIVPLYNGERFIAATLDSLADQTVPLHAVVVVDDGSVDRGPEIARAHPIGARVISQTNAGIAVARNRGAFAAESRFISFLDQDDLWMRNRHERLLAYLAEHPDCRALATSESRFYLQQDAAVLEAIGEGLHRTAVKVADEGTLTALCASRDGLAGVPGEAQSVTSHRLLEGTIGVTCSNVVERELFFSAGGCVPLARTMDDWLLMLNISRLTPFPLLDEPSVLYRVHPNSTTMTAEWSLAFLTAIAAARYGGTLVEPGHARDPSQVTLGLFWRHWLLDLARRDTRGLFDAVALLRLLVNTDESWKVETLRLVRTALATRLRRRIPKRL